MIGDTLRAEREKQKLSIQDIEKGTSIRSVYIEALENGEYDKLPGEVYAKGFVKNYGNFLNLDGEELVRQFIMEISSVAVDADNAPPADPNAKSSIVAPNIGSKYQTKTETTENFSGESDSRKYIAAAVAAVVLLIGGLFYGLSGSDDETTVAQAEVIKEKPVEVAVVETVQEVPQPVETPPPVETPAFNGVNLQATFNSDCWTRVVVDGMMFYEGMISAGESFDWKGEKSVTVLLGNAGAAQLTMNGQNVGAIGGYGDVVERTFTR